jgi:hypothetical protein
VQRTINPVISTPERNFSRIGIDRHLLLKHVTKGAWTFLPNMYCTSGTGKPCLLTKAIAALAKAKIEPLDLITRSKRVTH